MLALRWDAVDFESGHLRLADSKTGKSTRPIGASAMALLEAVPKMAGMPYVFPGAHAGQPLKDIRRLWFAVRTAAGLEGPRLHDLRHSFASVPASGGESLLIYPVAARACARGHNGAVCASRRQSGKDSG